MYDSVLKVPLILWAPGQVAAGVVDDTLVQLMDVAPTILNAAGIEVPAYWEARPLLDAAEPRDAVYAELARDHIQSAAEYIAMYRDRDWKLVYYLNQPDGELYRLTDDPDERRNLWAEAEYRSLRDQLQQSLLEWWMAATLRARRRPTRKPQAPMPLGSARH